ncbi:5-oxoprolinase subunit PxpA [Polaribacter sp.]|uniref:5-oxoprolinase subunit PxpA n=1 Tax=Polaribacter sp. TaxID=1920175 RepID=UPI003F6CAB61
MKKIDINCDVGEGVNVEPLLMPNISSCNVACGGHFGTKKTIEKTIQLAIKNKVLIGAHPSFPDKENFGRKLLNLSSFELKNSIEQQMELFLNCMNNYNQKMNHIKPHGALYNFIAKNKEAAAQFISITKKYLQNCYLYVPYNSEIERVALNNQIKIKYEAFADRNYNNDLSLVARAEKNALITNKVEVVKHVLFMYEQGKVKTISGALKDLKADTFCVHGDTENAVEILSYLKSNLKQNNILVG